MSHVEFGFKSCHSMDIKLNRLTKTQLILLNEPDPLTLIYKFHIEFVSNS